MREPECCLYCGRDTTAKCKICLRCRNCKEHEPDKETDPIKWSELEHWDAWTPPTAKDDDP